MNCGEFERRLNDALDERRNPASDFALEAHAAECAACRALSAAYRTIARRAAPPRPDRDPNDVASDVLASLRVPRRRRLAWSTAAAVVAAAAAVAVAVSLPGADPGDHPPAPSTDAVANVSVAPSENNSATAPLSAGAAESTAALAEETRASFAAALQALPLPAFERTADDHPSDDWVAGLGPVAHSAGESLAALFAWPSPRGPQDEPQ